MVLSSIRIPVQNGDVGLIFATYLCDVVGDRAVQLSNEHMHFDWFEPGRVAELLTISYPIEFIEKLKRLLTD